MKNTSVLLLAGLLSLTACSQRLSSSEVPSIVSNAIQGRFQQIKDPEWKKTGEGYEVEFKKDKIEYEAQVDSSGMLSRMKREISVMELPAAVKLAIETNYKDKKIDDIEQVEKNGVIYYQVELDARPKDINLVFTSDGKEDKQTPYWD